MTQWLRRPRFAVLTPNISRSIQVCWRSNDRLDRRSRRRVNARPLRGCIPILCTPFTETNELDLDSLRREIDWVITEGADGVAALAIASEGYKLIEPERDEITL